jgi:DNA polymerase III subunit delta'
MALPDVLGHERIKGLLSRGLLRGRLPPAMLFSGPDGVGKKTLALTVARALVCQAPGEPDTLPDDACETCAACSRATRGLHPDVIVVEPSTAAIKIDQVRDAVDQILSRPFEARARAVVIDEAHVMTEQAMNALLKALEEPPATSHVFLVSASPQALLPTIRSRCQILRFGPLPVSLLAGHLEAQHGLSAEDARLRATLCGGSLGAALAFEAEGYRGLRDELVSTLEGIAKEGGLWRLEAAEKLADGEDPMVALVVLRALLRDVAALHGGAPPESLLNADVAVRLRPLAAGPLGARAILLAESAEESRLAIKGNASKLLSMEVLLDGLAG